MATVYVHEVLPKLLGANAQQPALFDGTTRLYTNYRCPFAQRVWITRNWKGLQNQIKLVPIDLQNRPAWYKEKVNPKNQVPVLEHNGKIIGESLDLIKYLDQNFDGLPLSLSDPVKIEFGEQLLSHVDTFTKDVYTLVSKEDHPVKESGPPFDYVENALHKFDDGPFFLGQLSLVYIVVHILLYFISQTVLPKNFIASRMYEYWKSRDLMTRFNSWFISQVDIAYIPFVERFHIIFSEFWKHDITAGRPKLTAWIEEFNKIDAYKATKVDPKEHAERFKQRFLTQKS